MEIKINRIDGVQFAVLLTQSLDYGNAQDFQHDLLGSLHPDSMTVLDISSLKFVDSSGMGAILTCRRRLRDSGGDLKLLCQKGKPIRLFFEMARIYRIMEIVESTEEAIESYSQQNKLGVSTGT